MAGKIHLDIDSELKDLIPGFLENRQKDLIKIQDALNTNNFLEIKNIGHKMKGNAGGYGFDHLSLIGGKLEKAGGINDNATVKTCMIEIKEYLDSIEITYV